MVVFMQVGCTCYATMCVKWLFDIDRDCACVFLRTSLKSISQAGSAKRPANTQVSQSVLSATVLIISTQYKQACSTIIYCKQDTYMHSHSHVRICFWFLQRPSLWCDWNLSEFEDDQSYGHQWSSDTFSSATIRITCLISLPCLWLQTIDYDPAYIWLNYIVFSYLEHNWM